MKKTALLALIAVAVSSPSMAKSHHHYLVHRITSHHHVYAEKSHHRGYAEESHHHIYAEKSHHRAYAEKPASSHANITCDMVRAYVAQVGLVQARAMALSQGMTASEELRAKRCLENKT
jgi:hypothetical protein